MPSPSCCSALRRGPVSVDHCIPTISALDSVAGDVIDSAFVATKPFVNVVENDKAFEMHVAAPGLRKSDFKIEVRNGMLHVSTVESVEKATPESEMRSKEFDFTSFTRSFKMNERVDPENISARYEEGILVITLPKRVKDSWNKEIKID